MECRRLRGQVEHWIAETGLVTASTRSGTPWIEHARPPGCAASCCPVLPQCCPSPMSAETEKRPLPTFPLVRTAFRLSTPDRIRTGATALRVESGEDGTIVITVEER